MRVRMRRICACLTACAALLAVSIVPASAAPERVAATTRYEACWWQTHEPANSFECRGAFKGPFASVEVPTGECWSTDQQGGTVQILQAGQWVDVPNTAVQYKPSPYCTNPEEPFVSYVHWRFKVATFRRTQLRFLIPFNGGIDESSPSILCVRRIDYVRLCRT